jgi:hypothetical protein
MCLIVLSSDEFGTEDIRKIETLLNVCEAPIFYGAMDGGFLRIDTEE